MKKLLSSLLLIATLTGCAPIYSATGTSADYKYSTPTQSATIHDSHKDYSQSAPVHYYENVDGNRVQTPTYYHS